MKVNLSFDLFFDVIEFENNTNKYFETLATEFYDWYHEGKTLSGKTKTGFVINEEIYCWNGMAFVTWMNYAYPNCNAKLLAIDIMPGKEDKTLPIIKLN